MNHAVQKGAQGFPLLLGKAPDHGLFHIEKALLEEGLLLRALLCQGDEAAAGVAAADGAADQALFLHPVQHAVDGGGLHPEELRQFVLRDPPAVLLEVEEYMGLGRGYVVPGDPGVHIGLGQLGRPAQGGAQAPDAVVHAISSSFFSPEGQSR